MNLYLLSQSVNQGYDTYDSCVVCAANEDDARLIRPDDYKWEDDVWHYWVRKPEDVKVRLIGVAASDVLQNTVVLDSFNAG